MTAPVEAADRSVETLARAGLWRVFGILEPGPQHLTEPVHGCRESFETFGEPECRFNQPVDRRPCLRLKAIPAVGENRARQHLLPDQHQEFLEGLSPFSFADTLRPAVAGQDAGGGKDVEQSLGAVVIGLDKIADAAPQASRARSSAAFGA